MSDAVILDPAAIALAPGHEPFTPKPLIQDILRTKYCVPGSIFLVEGIDAVPVSRTGRWQVVRLLLGDGEHCVQALLSGPMQRFVHTGEVAVGSYVRLDKFDLKWCKSGDEQEESEDMLYLAVEDVITVGRNESFRALWEAEQEDILEELDLEDDLDLEESRLEYEASEVDKAQASAFKPMQADAEPAPSPAILPPATPHKETAYEDDTDSMMDDLDPFEEYEALIFPERKILTPRKPTPRATPQKATLQKATPSKPTPYKNLTPQQLTPLKSALKMPEEQKPTPQKPTQRKLFNSSIAAPTAASASAPALAPPSAQPSSSKSSSKRAQAPIALPRDWHDRTLPLKLTTLYSIPYLPYRQNWSVNVLAILVSLDPIEPSPLPPFKQRKARIADPSTAKHVLLSIFLDPDKFTPAVGSAVLLVGVKNHPFDGGSLKKYASDGVFGDWWFEDPWEMEWCDVEGIKRWWAEMQSSAGV
ncbi:hypothetical protein S40293_03277 [Stachybotrys chartarum IBT 40293]|nr:hypothetical protein S40293_03277 [Stachybotrys chartarum IBT 40293]